MIVFYLSSSFINNFGKVKAKLIMEPHYFQRVPERKIISCVPAV